VQAEIYPPRPTGTPPWRDRHNQLTNLVSLDSTEMVESDFSDYLSNLEEYENRLANGEIKW
jgi:hypothetical protein